LDRSFVVVSGEPQQSLEEMMSRKSIYVLLAAFLALALASCAQAQPTTVPSATPEPTQASEQATATSVPPTATTAAPTATTAPTTAPPEQVTYQIGTNAEYPPFESVDASGNVVGFDPDVISAIAERAGFDYEFVNTRWDGIFVALQSGEFDAVISAATITDERAEIVNFSDPYFNAGQMIAVRTEDANQITSVADLDGRKVGVQLGTTGDMWLSDNTNAEVVRYDEITLAFQALANGDVDAVFNDGPTSADIIQANPELGATLVGEPVTDEFYGVAVNKDQPELLAMINEGLAAIRADGTYDALYDKWFGAPETPAVSEGKDTLIIGTTDKVTVLDPADSYDFHTWEIHHNTMDTLLHYAPGTTDLEPGLATSYEVSDDGLEYTFHLVEGVSFPDGTPLNAEAVKWSIDRVIALEGDPNWLVTSFVDSVEVVDEYTVKFVLQAPVNYFPLLVATQPYSPVSPNCYPEDSFAADSTCGGVGPYKITKWDRDVEMVLEAYDGYPGPAPKTPKIIIRYYADSTTLRLAVESGEVDIATKTLNPTDYADLEAAGELQVIEGPGAQIRFLGFNSTTPPFDQPEIRQAIAAAVDRDAITSIAFQGTHSPLYSMVPMGMWSHIDAFAKRDLDLAKQLLTDAGYSESNKLEMDLWWTPTHYGPTEADLATVLKDNLEETGLISVSLQNTEWATYKEYANAGSMPVFLLGWYPDYLDPDNYTWSFAHSSAADDMGFFYANDQMDALLEAGQRAATLRGEDRLQIYEDIQQLWTTEVPTIPLTQGSLLVVAQPNVKGIVLDPNMLFHYFLLQADK
jgi:peptide/nickel transport system substrate-binding protein